MTRTISDQNVGTAQQGRRHRIRRVLITEGLLKGQTADLPDGLGCIIGGRGAGKSTLLELVRYALDAFAGCSEAELQRIASLVRDNLGAGRVVLTVQTAEGLEYNVSRAVDDPPVVLTPEGEPTDIRFSAADLLRASVYSQNQIENIASDPVSQLALIDGFDRDGIRQISDQLAPLAKDLALVVTEIMGTSVEIAKLEQSVSTLPVVEQKIKALSHGGSKAALAVNEAYKNKTAARMNAWRSSRSWRSWTPPPKNSRRSQGSLQPKASRCLRRNWPVPTASF